ncbi:MAG: site-specific integrase [Solirubrobacteraceae bacterium]
MVDWDRAFPNTVEEYARDVGLFWSFLAGRGVAWDRVSLAELAEFAAWARRPAENVVALSEQTARRSPRTVNRMLTAVLTSHNNGRDNARAVRVVVAASCPRLSAGCSTARPR